MKVISEISKRMEKVINKLNQILQSKGIKTILLKDENDIRSFLKNKISSESLVGMDDSVIHNNPRIHDMLRKIGAKIYYSFDGSKDYNRTIDSFEEHPAPDYYLFADVASTSEAELDKQLHISENAWKNNKHPKHIIAFTAIKNFASNIEDSITKFRNYVLDSLPPGTDITIAVMM